MKVLIAGVGNVLHGDDGFGVVVAERLAAAPLPPTARVIETGIGGIALVHELQAGWDALVVIDAVDRARPPGTVMVIEPEVLDVRTLPWSERHDHLADMHLATPERALMLARALGVLPTTVFIVGCQAERPDVVRQGLSQPVSAALDAAVEQVLELVEDLCAATAV